jgi:4-amino-4-deoxy-L-arabinose transferase-like glycosyltransferase
LSLRVLGQSEFAARLPNALMGLATVVALFVLGRRMYGTRPALLASVVLATAGEFFVLPRTVMHDISLTFFVTVGLGLVYAGVSRGFAERRWFILAAAAFGGAVLAKGPAGILVPGLVVLLFLVSRRQLGRVWQAGPGWSLATLLLVAAPWYVAIALANPEYVRDFLVELNIGSFVSSESNHPSPIWYYLPVLAAALFPWSLFLPLAAIRGWRRRGGDRHGATVFLLLWIAVYLTFFSLAVSKLATYYILPALPPAALLIGRL